jgi:hypothetical protein
VNGVNWEIGKVGHWPNFFPSPYFVRSNMALGMDGGEHMVVGKLALKSLRDEFIANSMYGRCLAYNNNNNVMNHLINILTNIIMKSNAK